MAGRLWRRSRPLRAWWPRCYAPWTTAWRWATTVVRRPAAVVQARGVIGTMTAAAAARTADQRLMCTHHLAGYGATAAAILVPCWVSMPVLHAVYSAPWELQLLPQRCQAPRSGRWTPLLCQCRGLHAAPSGRVIVTHQDATPPRYRCDMLINLGWTVFRPKRETRRCLHAPHFTQGSVGPRPVAAGLLIPAVPATRHCRGALARPAIPSIVRGLGTEGSGPGQGWCVGLGGGADGTWEAAMSSRQVEQQTRLRGLNRPAPALLPT
jgi:hypothetical protein